MTEYHKIDSVFKRDPQSKHRRMLAGEWSKPEFNYLSSNIWTFQEKVDGTNIRAEIAPSVVSFKGRTDAADIPKPLQHALAAQFLPIAKRLGEDFADGAIFYGEGYGGKIQKGGKYRPDPSFVLFDVRVGEYWLEQPNVAGIAAKFGLEYAPMIGSGTLWGMIERCEEGFESKWGGFPAEGIIARPQVELKNRSGQRIITKLKLRDFA